MATLNLGRVRMIFRGDFDTLNGQSLLFYDAVTFSGGLYVKVTDTPHIANTDETTGNQPSRDTTNWQLLANGVEYSGDWMAGIIYWKNQIVSYGASSYIAVQEVPNNRNTPDAEIAAGTGYWAAMAEGMGRYITNYNGSDALLLNTFVTYEGVLYNSTADVGAGENPTTNPEKFEVVAPGFNAEGTYQAGTAYNFRDVVRFGGNSYTVVTPGGTSTQPIDSTTGLIDANWQLVLAGFQYEGVYEPTRADGYYPGHVIQYDESVWVNLLRAQTGEHPDNSPSKWSEMMSTDTGTAVYFAMNDLLDVDTDSATNGSVLQYDGSSWNATNDLSTSTGVLQLNGGTY